MDPSFIEPLKSQGIRNAEDGVFVLGVKYVAKPGQRFVIRREAHQRILEAFRGHGIGLAGRGVVVRLKGAEAPGRRAAAFAATAVRRAEAGVA